MDFIRNCFYLLILPLLISGCANAVTYHHSERSSIALEARATDPQQPLQGTIGVKTRTIVVAPGVTQGTPATGSPGVTDSASVISDFNLERDPNGILEFGTTRIRSAFITGGAAKNASSATAAALSGLGAGAIDDLNLHRKIILQNIYNQLKEMAGDENTAESDETAKRHLANLNKLAELLPDISENTYYVMATPDNLKKVKPSIPGQGFQRVLDYANLLDTSIVSIAAMKKNRKVTLDSKPIGEEQLAKLLDAEKEIKKERREFFALIGNSSVIDSAASYVISVL